MFNVVFRSETEAKTEYCRISPVQYCGYVGRSCVWIRCETVECVAFASAITTQQVRNCNCVKFYAGLIQV